MHVNSASSLCGSINLLCALLELTENETELIKAYLHLPSRYHECLNCNGLTLNKPYKNGTIFCSKRCRFQYFNVAVKCDNCGRFVTRGPSSLTLVGYGHTFCCRNCFKIYYKYHARRTGRKRRHNYGYIRQVYLLTGSVTQTAEFFMLKRSYVSTIINHGGFRSHGSRNNHGS